MLERHKKKLTSSSELFHQQARLFLHTGNNAFLPVHYIIIIIIIIIIVKSIKCGVLPTFNIQQLCILHTQYIYVLLQPSQEEQLFP